MKITGSLLAASLIVVAAEDALAQNNPGVSPSLMFGCEQSVIYDNSTSGATLLVSGNSHGGIYVCGFTFYAGGSANVGLVYSSISSCTASTTKITPAFELGAQTGIVDHLPVYTGLPAVPPSSNLCLNVSSATSIQAIVYYTQFP